jgi:hypothetical protein
MTEDLTESTEVLYRQIHPSYLHEGIPSSDRFRPSARDMNKLSVDRGSLVTAAESHANYTSSGKASAAVFGLSVREFNVENIGCCSAPVFKTDETEENLAHALADYSPHVDSAQKLVAKRLQRLAIIRGILHEG